MKEQKSITTNLLMAGLLLCCCGFARAQGPCEAVTGPDVPLFWDANTETNIEYYRLLRSDIQGSGYAPVNTVFQGPDPISLTDFNPLSQAYYVVTAVNDSGLESGFSNELCVSIMGPPALPFPTPAQFETFTLPGD